MKRFKYTPEHIDYLKTGYLEKGIPELATAFNARFGLSKSRSEIHATIKNHRLTCGRKTGEILKGTSLVFTPEQVKYIKDNYNHFSRRDLTSELNNAFKTDFKVSQIVAFTKNHKIISGRSGRFETGSKSWNKGTKGLTSRNRTTFVKGSVPPNIRPLGSERVDSKEGFVLVKIAEQNPYTGAPTRFKHKHVHVWEQKNGPVPEGHAVVFKDSNKLNCGIENLMLVTRNELLSLNLHGYKGMPCELKPAVLIIAKIEAKGRFRTRPGRGRIYA